MNVIGSYMLARDSCEKPVSTFSHPALKFKRVFYMFQRIPVMIANALRTRRGKAPAFVLIDGKANEMNAIAQTCRDIVKIVANENYALGRQGEALKSAGEDLELGAAAIGAKGMALKGLP